MEVKELLRLTCDTKFEPSTFKNRHVDVLFSYAAPLLLCHTLCDINIYETNILLNAKCVYVNIKSYFSLLSSGENDDLFICLFVLLSENVSACIWVGVG